MVPGWLNGTGVALGVGTKLHCCRRKKTDHGPALKGGSDDLYTTNAKS
jgi:hypothetical protein